MIGEPVTFPSVMDIPDPDAPILLSFLFIDLGIFTFARSSGKRLLEQQAERSV